MSPRVFGCVVCGYDVDYNGPEDVGWWMEYRISMLPRSTTHALSTDS